MPDDYDNPWSPKVESACDFSRATGGIAGICALKVPAALLRGEAGTIVTTHARGIEYHRVSPMPQAADAGSSAADR